VSEGRHDARRACRPACLEVWKKFGKEYIEDEYINERTLLKVLQNMRVLYKKIKGE